MSVAIYITIIILFLLYLIWTWNNTKSFEGTGIRISYIIIGTLFVTLVTYIIFLASKNSITYPSQEIIKVLRNIILLTFIPINGFMSLPYVASTIGKIKNDTIDTEKLKTRVLVFLICALIVAIIECHYFGSIQNQIIQLINSK